MTPPPFKTNITANKKNEKLKEKVLFLKIIIITFNGIKCFSATVFHTPSRCGLTSYFVDRSLFKHSVPHNRTKK